MPQRCRWVLCAVAVGALSASGLAAPVAAQDSLPPADTAGPSGGTIVPLPALFYQPETGTGFGVLVTYYFRPGRAGRDTPPSELGLTAIYTTKKQILTSLGTRLYLSGGSLRVAGNVAAIKFPTKFWGIGNATPDEAEEDYTPLAFLFVGEALQEVRRGWFLGGRVQVAHRTLREVSDSGQLVTGTVPGSEDGRAVEGSLLVTYDVRDNTIYPNAGAYVQLTLLGAATALASDFGYGGLQLDARAYLSPLSRHVLALRALTSGRSGTPPFDMLPQLGGDALLRGYYQGRFRDEVLVALQSEYRLPVFWRIGAVGFAAVGRVAPRYGDLSLDDLKVSLGGGLRFLLSRQEGLNIRADYGWGFDVQSGGFYLGIGEAF